MTKKPADGESQPAPPPLNLRAWALIRDAIQGVLGDEGRTGEQERHAFDARVPEDVRRDIATVLESYQGTRRSYRIALIGQLAFGIESDTPLDLTKRPPGARGGLGGRVGKLLAENHIVSVDDAYQNIAKNNLDMVRGNFPEFDRALTWAARVRSKDELRAVFDYFAGISLALPVRFSRCRRSTRQS